MRKSFIIACVAFIAICPSAFAQDVDVCLTKPDRSALCEYLPGFTSFTNVIAPAKGWSPFYPTIVVDDRQTYQEIEGFGFAITGGTAQHLMSMTPEVRKETIEKVFGRNPGQGGVNYIRLSIGSSDLNSFTFSYDDMPEGEEDFELKHFSLGQDLKDVVPVVKEILKVNPTIKILGSPWSGPVWMKENKNIRGGKLRKECYSVYADYFVKYVQAMAEQGITIDAVTYQNEPQNSKNTPSMPWSAQDGAEFVGKYLGPKFEAAGLKTKILIFDHNVDREDYPLTILKDNAADKYTDGIAYHQYVGDLTAMTHTHMARPDKDIYFTEEMATEKQFSETIAIAAPIKGNIIDVVRNWSKNAIMWNLAADSNNDPHTDNGGCSGCQGALAIDNGKVTSYNVVYYVVAQIAPFVPDGSVRIASTAPYDPAVTLYEDEQNPGVFRSIYRERSNVLPNVAFKTPEGKIALLVANTTVSDTVVRIQYKGGFAFCPLQAGAVATFVWNSDFEY